jgi:hypothetical protein
MVPWHLTPSHLNEKPLQTMTSPGNGLEIGATAVSHRRDRQQEPELQAKSTRQSRATGCSFCRDTITLLWFATTTVGVSALICPQNSPGANLQTSFCGVPESPGFRRERDVLARIWTFSKVRDLTYRASGAQRCFRLNSRRNDDDGADDSAESEIGMERAFEQLDSLPSSLFKDGSGEGPGRKSTDGEKLITPPDLVIEQNTPPLEEQVSLYKGMMEEVEKKGEDDLYSDMLADMLEGSGIAATSSKLQQQTKKESPEEDEQPLLLSALLSAQQQATDTKPKTTDELIDNVLHEVFQEINKPGTSATGDTTTPLVSDLQSDQSLRKEIEAIFERGNEQLLQSLEEMRHEQQELAAKQSAAAQQKQDKAASSLGKEDRRRLEKAESAMEQVLRRVTAETEQVEKAVQDLQAAQKSLETGTDLASKLRSGGLPKQAALSGFLLFSLRSILDTVAALGNAADAQALTTSALLQSAVAFACAAYFFLA